MNNNYKQKFKDLTFTKSSDTQRNGTRDSFLFEWPRKTSSAQKVWYLTHRIEYPQTRIVGVPTHIAFFSLLVADLKITNSLFK